MRTVPPALSVIQRIDGRDRDQVLHRVSESVIERDQCVVMKLGQGDVLGEEGVAPAELVRDVSCNVLQDAVPESRIRNPRR